MDSYKKSEKQKLDEAALLKKRFARYLSQPKKHALPVERVEQKDKTTSWIKILSVVALLCLAAKSLGYLK